MNRTLLSIAGAVVVGVGITYLTSLIPGPPLEFKETDEPPEFVEVDDAVLDLVHRTDSFGYQYNTGSVSSGPLMMAVGGPLGDYAPLRLDHQGRLIITFGPAEPEVGRVRGKYESNFP